MRNNLHAWRFLSTLVEILHLKIFQEYSKSLCKTATLKTHINGFQDQLSLNAGHKY